MNKPTISLMIAALLPFNAIANSCKIEGYTIGFFNGVATTRKQAINGKDKLQLTLNVEQYSGQDVDYQLFYNDSYIDEGKNHLPNTLHSIA